MDEEGIAKAASAAADSRLNPEYDGPRAVWISGGATDNCKFAHKISTRATGTYAVHTHTFYEIVYILSGEVDFFIAGHVYPLGGGSMVTFPPGVRHGVLVRTSAPYERFTLHFDPQVLSLERRRLLMSVMPKDLLGVATAEQGEAAVWRGMEHSGVSQILEAMEALRSTEKSTLTALLPIYLEAILAALVPRTRPEPDTAARESAGHSSSQTQQIVAWVDQHYTEQVTLEALSERFYLSKGYLSSLFRQATGSSVKDYVRSRRMAHVQMLLSAGVPTAQAAARVGFGDYTTFYRAYIRSFGHAPSADAQETARNARDELLAQALSAQVADEKHSSPGAILFPERGTETEDPSMVNAVRAEGLPDEIGGK